MSRTVKEALKIAQRKVRPIDISTGEPRTVPEKPETIRMQLRQLTNGKRAGVFVARGTKGVTLPEGMRVAQMREGNIIFDPSVISKEDVIEAAQSGRLNELLGYVQSKPEALARSLEQGEFPRMVVSRDKNGVEQDSAAVSPDRAEEQAEVFEDRARGGSTVSVEPLHDGVLRDRMAEGGVPDEESQEKFLKEQLEGSAPQYEPEAGLKTAKELGLMAAGFAPGSGIASAAGKFPTAEGGFEPSAKEDWQAGRYGSAALKAAGAAGDVISAIPVAGTAAGALLKAPLAAKLAMAAAPMAKVAKEAASAAKAAEETVEAAKPAYQRLVNPAGFYSRAHEAAMTELPEGERTWQEMHSLLSKAPRVQKEELYWSGIHPETFDPKQKVTREQIGEMIEKNFPKVSPVVKGGAKESAYPHRTADEWQGAINRAERAQNWDEAERLQNAWEEFEGYGANEMAPMHEQYTVPGGENYSERILTHDFSDPELAKAHKEAQKNWEDRMAETQAISDRLAKKGKFDVNNPEFAAAKQREEEAWQAVDTLAEKFESPENQKSLFRHEAHLGDINNPILHTRNSERNIPGRGKVWHQEEVQSDWAQQGREQGFKEPLTSKEQEELAQLQNQDSEIRQQMQIAAKSEDDAAYDQLHLQRSELLGRIKELKNKPDKGMPAAPHVRDTEHWLDLAAKDTLKNAIEGGHDHIFITGGQEQAKRWSNELRKAVDNVRWESSSENVKDLLAQSRWGENYSNLTSGQQQQVNQHILNNPNKLPVPSESKTVYAKPIDSNTEHRFVVKQVEGPNGKPRIEIVDSSIPSAEGETLSSVVGSDLAKRIMSEESGEQAMKGYRMGSEGYSQTYERKYPSSFKKLIKGLDPEAKIERGNLENVNPTGQKVRDFMNEFMSNELGRIAREEYGTSAENLTSAQREDILSDLSIDARQAALQEFGHSAVDAAESTKSVSEPVEGTWIEITPKMRTEYNRLKQKHGAVFPAYERGGTVDAKSNSRYTGADRRLLERALHLTRKLTE